MAADPAVLAKAEALIDVSRFHEAKQHLVTYVAAAPESVDAWCLLASCELGLDAPSAAVRAAETAIRLAPGFDVPHRLRALGLSQSGLLEPASTAAAEAVRLGPLDYRNHYTVAQILVNRHNLEPEEKAQARHAALRAVEMAPHDPDVHVVAGLAAGRLKQKEVERASYREALRLDPDNAMALNNLAAMDVGGIRLGRAAKRLVAGLRLAPEEKILKENLDAVGRSLIARLLLVALLCGLGHIVLIHITGAWAQRAAVGAGFALVSGLLVWQAMRHLPAGSRRFLRSLPRRAQREEQALIAGAALLAVADLVVAAIPADIGTVPAEPATILGEIVGRGIRIMGLFMAIMVVTVVWACFDAIVIDSRACRLRRFS